MQLNSDKYQTNRFRAYHRDCVLMGDKQYNPEKVGKKKLDQLINHYQCRAASAKTYEFKQEMLDTVDWLESVRDNEETSKDNLLFKAKSTRSGEKTKCPNCQKKFVKRHVLHAFCTDHLSNANNTCRKKFFKKVTHE